MLIKRTSDCNEFTANDGCRIREVFHPANDGERLGGGKLPYSLAIARLEPGRQSYDHYLRQAEVYYILEGRGVMHVGEEAAEVGPGDAVYVPPGASQWVSNSGDGELVFAVIVSPPWSAEDDVRL